MPDFGDSGEQTGARYEYQGQRDPNDVGLSGDALAAYQHQRQRQGLWQLLALLGATTGLSALGGALSGAGTAAASGALPAIEGGAPWAVTPFAGTASMVPTGAAAVGGTIGAGVGATGAGAGAGAGTGAGAGAAGSGAGAASGGFLGMSARDLAALGLGLGGTIGGALSPRPNMDPNTSTKDPQLQELLAMMSGRLKKSEPLFESVQSMANGLLPTQYQKGGGGMT